MIQRVLWEQGRRARGLWWKRQTWVLSTEEVKLGQEPVGLDEGGKGGEVVGLDGALELVILEYSHRYK